MAFIPHIPLRLTRRAFPSPRPLNSSSRPPRYAKPQSCPCMSQSQTPPPPLSLPDTLSIWVENILVLFNLRQARDSTPIAEGDLSAIFGDSPFFLSLHQAFEDTGPVYKLAFGPKVFVVVQDPVMARRILKEESILYSKGILAEILEEVMGKGLIPADYETWKIRRRAIVPGFHTKWLAHQTQMFADVAQKMCNKLARIDGASVVDMEAEYCSLALDIIGRAVFNYDFESVTQESPIIKAVYRSLKETEHRSTTFFPYWKIPGAPDLVPRLKSFYADMKLINDTLSTLIQSAKNNATSLDLTELENREYENVSDPSLLRFLVELRGEETTDAQLRDDLMTMLIAGHETTAAVLTWATAELAQNPDILEKAREEVDRVLGDRLPTYADVAKLSYLRRIIAETLRLYPAPPVLIRRLLADTTLPKGGSQLETQLRRGTDLFINVYSLHRSPALWDDPVVFNPERWLKPKENPGVEGWGGYSPAAGLEQGKPLYPNESNADFAFLPFGGGSRKCVGDHFALLEAVVSLSMVVQRFDLALENPGEPVEMTTGATIHTKHGLNMRLVERKRTHGDGAEGAERSSEVPAIASHS